MCKDTKEGPRAPAVKAPHGLNASLLLEIGLCEYGCRHRRPRGVMSQSMVQAWGRKKGVRGTIASREYLTDKQSIPSVPLNWLEENLWEVGGIGSGSFGGFASGSFGGIGSGSFGGFASGS